MYVYMSVYTYIYTYVHSFIHSFIHTYVHKYVFISIICNSNYGLMTVKAKHVSVSCDYACKIIFDGAQYGLLLLLLLFFFF